MIIKKVDRMKIKLNNRYEITCNANNYILIEHKKRAADNEKLKHVKGDPYIVEHGYYGTLQSLITGLIEHEIKQVDISEIKELSDYIKDFCEDLKANLLKEFDVVARQLINELSKEDKKDALD
jgi:uncharacterized protein YutD